MDPPNDRSVLFLLVTSAFSITRLIKCAARVK